MTTKESLEKINHQVANCQNCSLYKTATQPVPGNGQANSSIVFIGEAPGHHEDQQGIPFCGTSGKLLDKLLSQISLTRDQVFVTNILKHRPPENRDPQPEEINACTPFLRQQLLVIKPKVIITLGRFAMNFFLPHEYISQVHGQSRQIHWEGIDLTLYPVYHPAAAMRRIQVSVDLEADFAKIPLLIQNTDQPKATVTKTVKKEPCQNSLF